MRAASARCAFFLALSVRAGSAFTNFAHAATRSRSVRTRCLLASSLPSGQLRRRRSKCSFPISPDLADTTDVVFDEGTLAKPPTTLESELELKEHLTYGEMIGFVYDTYYNKQCIYQGTLPLFDNVEEVRKLYDAGEDVFGMLAEFRQKLRSSPMAEAIKIKFPGYQLQDLLFIDAKMFDFTAGVTSYFGYIAYNEQKQDLVLVWRGTLSDPEWAEDFKFFQQSDLKVTVDDRNLIRRYITLATETLWSWILNKTFLKSRMIHRGFMSLFWRHDIYTALQVLGDLPSVRKGGPQSLLSIVLNDEKVRNGGVRTITCVGHSLGAALATVAGYELAVRIAKPQLVTEALRLNEEKALENFEQVKV